MSDYGVSKLGVRRVVDLIKEYRQTLHQLELNKKQDFPLPLGWTVEQEEAFIDAQIVEIDKQKARIKNKLEKVCERALLKLGVVSDVTITENRYGRIRAMAVCPACKKQTDLAESVDWAVVARTLRIRLRCMECGAQKVVTVVG